MSRRVCGILLILLSIISIWLLFFVFPCNDPNCIDPACKDITGALFSLTLGSPMVIDSFIHKNISGV